MYDYKALRRVIMTLAALFGVVLVVLVLTALPLNKFAWLSVVLLVVVGVYFVTIPLKLLKEMGDMEAIIQKYKKDAAENKKSEERT